MVQIPDFLNKSGISIGISLISNPTVISHQSSVISHQSSAISQQSTVITQQSTVITQQSTVNKHGRCNRNRYS
ncbi:hypothetical protein QUB37_10170 [Microcoleus sp. AT3-A2]|uniref:hypothetical protein n=1 Tax=unclassified Microcoleus TaxID=2642155 RepID=UPI002FCF05E3